MKSYIVLALVTMTVLIVKVQVVATDPPCKKYFDIFILQEKTEECGPANIVDHCLCPKNQLRWTECLYNALGLYEPCPQPNDCVNLTALNHILLKYPSKSKDHCH